MAPRTKTTAAKKPEDAKAEVVEKPVSEPVSAMNADGGASDAPEDDKGTTDAPAAPETDGDKNPEDDLDADDPDGQDDGDDPADADQPEVAEGGGTPGGRQGGQAAVDEPDEVAPDRGTVNERSVDAVAGRSTMTAKAGNRIEKPEPVEVLEAAQTPNLPVDKGQARANSRGAGIEGPGRRDPETDADGNPPPSAPIDPLAEPRGSKAKSISAMNEVTEFHKQRPGFEDKLAREQQAAIEGSTDYKRSFEMELKRTFGGADILVRDDEVVVVPKTAGVVPQTIRYGSRKLENAEDRRSITSDMQTALGR